jgi:hypothetical protein
MRTTTLLVTSLATLLVAGCGHLSRPDDKNARPVATGPRCQANETVCHITVRVRGCQVRVDPDWKRVAFRPGGVRMLWTLRDSKGVIFAPRGITFEPSGDKKGVVFTPDRGEVAADMFAMHNSTAVGEYKYTVNVIDNGKECKPHDPGVINQM